MNTTEGNDGGSLKRMDRPLYPSRDYKEYCADQKRKGLTRRHWKDLPEMWKEELAFRRELEDALNERPNAALCEPAGREGRSDCDAAGCAPSGSHQQVVGRTSKDTK